MRRTVEILYSDQHLVIALKPGGLLSVPGRGPDKQDCLVTRLQHQYPTMIAQPAVHRLDMYTSGLMVVAITATAHKDLSRQFAERTVYKEYVALVQGCPQSDSGEISLPFRVDLENRPLQIHDPIHGKMGITRYEVLSSDGTTARVKFVPLTGRTHQLRVHAAHTLGLGCPIVGDSLYGSGMDGEKMYLHASFLRFTHPHTGENMEIFSPPDF